MQQLASEWDKELIDNPKAFANYAWSKYQRELSAFTSLKYSSWAIEVAKGYDTTEVEFRI